MVIKSNRSSLWHHNIGTCRRLRWLCCEHSNNVARHDKTPLKSTFCGRTKIFCQATQVSGCVLVTLCYDFYTFRSCNACIFSLTTSAVLWISLYIYDIRHNFCCCCPVHYKTFYETAWSILFWSHKIDVTNLVKVHREYSSTARILDTKFDWACDVIFMASK